MDKITLTPSGQILRQGSAAPGNPLSWLACLVELDPEFTLASFFSLVRKYEIFIQMSQTLEALVSMAEAAGEAYPETPDVERLVFYKTVAMKGFPGKPGIEIYNSLKGVKGGQILGLKFFQLESLLGHRLCLGALEHIIFGDRQDMFTYETHYSLFELIEGVSWELSFNFNPLHCSIRG